MHLKTEKDDQNETSKGKRFLDSQPQQVNKVLAVYDRSRRAYQHKEKYKIQLGSINHVLYLNYLSHRLSATTDTNYSNFDRATRVLLLKVSEVKTIKFIKCLIAWFQRWETLQPYQRP